MSEDRFYLAKRLARVQPSAEGGRARCPFKKMRPRRVLGNRIFQGYGAVGSAQLRVP